MFPLERFWKERIEPRLQTGTHAQNATDAKADLADLVRVAPVNTFLAVEVHVRLRCRYYPGHVPKNIAPVPYEYDKETKRCTVQLNGSELDFVTSFYCSQRMENACFHLQDRDWDFFMPKAPDVLPVPIPVGLFRDRVCFSFEPTVFSDHDGTSHPELPAFCLLGVVLDHQLHTEMHRRLWPNPKECIFPGLGIDRNGFYKQDASLGDGNRFFPKSQIMARSQVLLRI